ncbi:CLOCK-interacting pacemaker [Polymixia lowei]
MRKDINSIENAMSTKRKAEGHHLRPGSKLRTIKSVNSRPDSERDSGFSDASSEHMSTMDTTDAEDSPRPVVQQGPQCNSSGSQSSQLAVVGGSYSNLSSMIIMNNVLLKQPGDNPPALKPWGFRPAVEVVQPVVQQPQVVFLQPVVSQQASKEASSRHRRSKKYLPILKSYPKIAPHPGDGSSSSGRGSASSSPLSSSSSSTYSSSSGSERGSTSTSSHRERYHRDRHQQKSLTRGPSNSGTTTTPSLPAPPSSVSPLVQQRLALPLTETSSSSSSSPVMERPLSAISQSELTPPLSLTPSNHTSSKTQTLPLCIATEDDSCHDEPQPGDGDPDTKRKRFCNTYNILSKSGLLDITLRTKELLRQNRRTQSDLDRLKEHTNLFLQAVQSGDNSICLKLQASLQEDDGGHEKERGAQSGLKAD